MIVGSSDTQQQLLMFCTEKLSITVIGSTASAPFHKRWLVFSCSDSQVTIYAVCKERRLISSPPRMSWSSARSIVFRLCFWKLAFFFLNKSRGFLSAGLSFRNWNSPPFGLFSMNAHVHTQERRGNLGCRFPPAGAPTCTAAILSDAEWLKSQSVPGFRAPVSRTLPWPFSSLWQPENRVCDPEF